MTEPVSDTFPLVVAPAVVAPAVVAPAVVAPAVVAPAVPTPSAVGVTPSQTVGPYFTMRLGDDRDRVLVGPLSAGTAIRLVGRVLDGDRKPIEDALVEIWQADAAGHYAHPLDGGVDRIDGWTGYGRSPSGFVTGAFSFRTVRPGPVPHPSGLLQAPHLNLIVQARGMLNASFTRVYFADLATFNALDPVLAAVPAERRSTLIATLVDPASDHPVRQADHRPDGEPGRRPSGPDVTRSPDFRGPPTYRFDIRFQGADETVFFDV